MPFPDWRSHVMDPRISKLFVENLKALRQTLPLESYVIRVNNANSKLNVDGSHTVNLEIVLPPRMLNEPEEPPRRRHKRAKAKGK